MMVGQRIWGKAVLLVAIGVVALGVGAARPRRRPRRRSAETAADAPRSSEPGRRDRRLRPRAAEGAARDAKARQALNKARQALNKARIALNKNRQTRQAVAGQARRPPRL